MGAKTPRTKPPSAQSAATPFLISTPSAASGSINNHFPRLRARKLVDWFHPFRRLGPCPGQQGFGQLVLKPQDHWDAHPPQQSITLSAGLARSSQPARNPRLWWLLLAALLATIHLVHFRVCPVSQPCIAPGVHRGSLSPQSLHIALTPLALSERSGLFYWISVACAALTSFSTPQISPSRGVHFWTGLRHCVYEQFLPSWRS